MMPRLSVIMTIYNPGRFLKPAIDSLLNQTFADFELVAVENGSKDGAKEVMRAYAAGDPRIRLIDLPENIGRTPALNRALSEATGEYVAVQDADDVSAPERLAKQVSFLDAHPDMVLAATHCRFIDADGRETGTFAPPVESSKLADRLCYDNPFPHSSCVYRRISALRAGGYPEAYPFAQDLGLWIALARFGRLGMIPELLVDIRRHESMATVSPRYSIDRHRDAIALYTLARKLPGVTYRARATGRHVVSNERRELAKAFWNSGKTFSALTQVVRSFLSAPVFTLRVMRGRLCESRASCRKPSITNAED